MPLKRDENGFWTLEIHDSDEQSRISNSHVSYSDSLPKYLNAFDPVFISAKEKSEANFLWSIFAVRGVQDAGWDPYETTTRAINAIRDLSNDITGESSRHLALWLYGHIMEASEPYEFLANLIDITQGGRFLVERFPPSARGVPQSPQSKIEKLERDANIAGFTDAVLPLKESWDRDLRNAIFHADYSLYGPEVRTIRPVKIYSHDQIMTLVNKALAYHEAMTVLRNFYIGSYTEPVEIPCDPCFSSDPREKFFVIVREGHGAVGLKDGWTIKELNRGHIPHRIGRFTPEEVKLLDADQELALLPSRKSK